VKEAAELSLQRPGGDAPSRWNRGVVIRFVLAITPMVVFAILGAVQQHIHAH
jgi:hypothetical protein